LGPAAVVAVTFAVSSTKSSEGKLIRTAEPITVPERGGGDEDPVINQAGAGSTGDSGRVEVAGTGSEPCGGGDREVMSSELSLRHGSADLPVSGDE
jgi:hypothetical protein